VAVSKLVRAELDRHDWAGLRCGCGGMAEHVPDIFLAIVEAAEPEEALGFTLTGHLEVQANLYEVAVPGVEVILAALTGELSGFARVDLFGELCRILVGGESASSEISLGRDRLEEECLHKARAGIWVILREGLESNPEDAQDILEVLEPDPQLLSYYSGLFGKRLEKRR
jgi:hypothetical protein